MLKEKLYQLRNWKSVIHTTWNPDGPDVIHIHMIPPKFHPFRLVSPVVLLNGQNLLPLNTFQAVLLTEFIQQANACQVQEMNDEQLQGILQNVFHQMRTIYPYVPDALLAKDLGIIIDTFACTVQGKTAPQAIGIVSLKDYAPYMTAPHHMDLMVADTNQNEAGILSTAQWKEIITACYRAKIPQLTFTGGEPALREDLCELIAKARWFVTRLNTSGAFLTPELCTDLVKAGLDSVQITLYSSDQMIHNELAGTDNYEQVIAGIQNALAAGLNVSVSTPLCSKNIDYLKTLFFLHKLGVTRVTCSVLNQAEHTAKAADEIYEALRPAAHYCHTNRMEISFTSPDWIEAEKLLDLELLVPFPGACLSRLAITPSGKVIPCQDQPEGEVLGDMRQDSFSKIWNHPVCKKKRSLSAATDICTGKGNDTHFTYTCDYACDGTGHAGCFGKDFYGTKLETDTIRRVLQAF